MPHIFRVPLPASAGSLAALHALAVRAAQESFPCGKGPRAKVELALARGKEGRDRRREIAARDVRRDVEREFKGRYRD